MKLIETLGEEIIRAPNQEGGTSPRGCRLKASHLEELKESISGEGQLETKRSDEPICRAGIDGDEKSGHAGTGREGEDGTN